MKRKGKSDDEEGSGDMEEPNTKKAAVVCTNMYNIFSIPSCSLIHVVDLVMQGLSTMRQTNGCKPSM